MSGHPFEHLLIILPGQVIAAQILLGVGPVEEGSQMMGVFFEHEIIFADGIVPLLELQVHRSLLQMEVRRIRLHIDALSEHIEGVFP